MPHAAQLPLSCTLAHMASAHASHSQYACCRACTSRLPEAACWHLPKSRGFCSDASSSAHTFFHPSVPSLLAAFQELPPCRFNLLLCPTTTHPPATPETGSAPRWKKSRWPPLPNNAPPGAGCRFAPGLAAAVCAHRLPELSKLFLFKPGHACQQGSAAHCRDRN